MSVGGQNITDMRGCVTCVRLTGQSVGPCESLPSPARGTHTVPSSTGVGPESRAVEYGGSRSKGLGRSSLWWLAHA